MPKEAEFFNAASAGESTAPLTTKATENNGRSGSTSSRYRVASRPSNLLMPSSTDVPDGASRSLETRLSASNAPSLLMRISKSSMSRLPLAAPIAADQSVITGKRRVSRFAITDVAIPSRGSGGTAGTPKLPQKLRQHVNRLRSQFVLGSSSRNLSIDSSSPSPSPTASNHKTRPSMSSSSMTARRFSLAFAAVQYSHGSHQYRQLEAAKEDREQNEPTNHVLKPPSSPQDSDPSTNAVTFQDLLRPLQNSLSCASLTSEWSSDEDDEAEQLFRQSERENSRMLRVCCSIDNLLLSISDQAQEQKHNEAIARGATRDLVKLLQFGIKQVISVIFGKSENQSENNNIVRAEENPYVDMKLDGKEAQYAMEFLVEITERIGKVEEFARSVFVREIDGLRQRTKELEDEIADAALKNEQLQSEIRDLRDFHEQNNVSSVDAFAGGHASTRFPVIDNPSNDLTIPNLTCPDIPDVLCDDGESESSVLKQPCQELLRLLEMAKQEIRLSHNERDVHKARVAEISSALFHDSELGLLRNQLQSEKKRVRVLERENLALRETQQDQAHKLQSLQTAGVDPLAAPNAGGASLSSSGRHGHGAAESTSVPATQGAPVVQGDSIPRNDPIDEQLVVQTNPLNIATENDQYNFVAGSTKIAQGGGEVIRNWFSRIVTPPSTNSRNSRKKKAEPKLAQEPRLALSKFLVGLMMTDKQLSAAQGEAKIRRQGNAPAIDPPVGALAARREARSAEVSTGKVGSKRRRSSAVSTSAPGSTSTHASSTEAEENREEIVACCLQLVWAFYQRFLLAVEAQNILGDRGLGGDPTMGANVSSGAGRPVTEPVSLSHIVFHYFFEHCAHEPDAVRELEQFVRCLHSVRDANYSLELFCQFLEETRSRRELCFFLWVCQAMDNLVLGIPYHEPLPRNFALSAGNGHTHPNQSHQSSTPTQYICVLKATFLARTIFRLLHFKVLCRPATVGNGKRRGNAKRNSTMRKSSTPAVPTAPSSPSSSPKRKPKTRIGEVTPVLESPIADAAPANGTSSSQPLGDQQGKSPHKAAQAALREMIETNKGQPITLEGFNNLLLDFAVVPSIEELTARLGAFYQPTGDERKIPVDVFLALLMETYSFQMQWQRDQLCALFIHLNHQEEIQQRVAEKLAKTDAAGAKGDRRKTGEAKPPKQKLRRKRSRAGVAENVGAGGSKYLRGLSRNVLLDLLVQAGIVHDSDLAQLDINWLFAGLVETAGGSAADITFDALFEGLHRLRWLDNNALHVDALVEVTGVTGVSTTKRSADGARAQLHSRAKSLSKPRNSTLSPTNPVLLAIRDKWRVYARRSIAVCNNDPNAFIRRHSERLLHYADHQFISTVAQFDSSAAGAYAGFRSSQSGSFSLLHGVWLQSVAEALRTSIDTMAGYNQQQVSIEANINYAELQFARGQSSRNNEVMFDGLQSFYNTSRMRVEHLIGDNETTSQDSVSTQLHELESVIALYAAHIAHLFQRFSEARFNCGAQVSFHRWRSMIYELRLVHPRYLPFSTFQSLFVSVVEPLMRLGSSKDNRAHSAALDQELGVGKTQFSELFVLIALERHRVVAMQKIEKMRVAISQKMKSTKDDKRDLAFATEDLKVAERPARIMAVFCREVLAPRAFSSDESINALVERDFAAKLSCPLVGRALLEHRAFLRTVFFYYAKQDEIAADEFAALEEQALLQQLQDNGDHVNGAVQSKESGADSPSVNLTAALMQPDPGEDFQLEKTKRSSMSFGEFQTFLAAFGILDSGDDESFSECRSAMWNGKKVALADAQQVFSSVMTLENDDTEQLEFDEFAAAIVALAMHLNPSPFTLWHQKLDNLATKMQRIWEAQEESISLRFG